MKLAYVVWAVQTKTRNREIRLSQNEPHALNFYPTKSKFGIPNPDLVYQIQIWYTKSRFGIPNSGFHNPTRFGIPKSKFGIPKSKFGIPKFIFGKPKYMVTMRPITISMNLYTST